MVQHPYFPWLGCHLCLNLGIVNHIYDAKPHVHLYWTQLKHVFLNISELLISNPLHTKFILKSNPVLILLILGLNKLWIHPSRSGLLAEFIFNLDTIVLMVQCWPKIELVCLNPRTRRASTAAWWCLRYWPSCTELWRTWNCRFPFNHKLW